MPTITSLRTLRIDERPNLIWLELETDDGRKGLGESFRGTHAVEAVIHDQIAPWLLGRDAQHIEAISNYLMNPCLGFHSASAEIRAASAVDIALWDLAGQRQGIPTYVALGGGSRDYIKAYNTCAGYAYNTSGTARRSTDGTEAPVGPYDDQVAFMRDAGTLARSLVDEGYQAMKIWPFDTFATATGGHLISLSDLKKGLEPFKKIRQAVGDQIEIMCELHSLWTANAATRICQALEDYNVFWAEDPIAKMDDAHALADLRSRTRTPICGSETLAGMEPFRNLLAANALDIVMLDLAWCGGLTEGRKIAALAQSYARPIAPHDCTGPVTLIAGLHLAMHAPTAIFQEVVRATLSTWYQDLVTELPVIKNGMVLAPEQPGLGTQLQQTLFQRPDAHVRLSRLTT